MQDFFYRLRNSLSTPNVISFSIGAGMALIGLFVPIGWNVPKPVAQTLAYAGFALLALGIGLTLWRFFGSPREKTSRRYSIVSTLSNMETSLWRLVGRRVNSIDPVAFLPTAKKIITLMNVAPPRASTIGEARDELSSLLIEIEDKVSAKKEIPLNERVERIRSIGRLLDHDGFGLAEQREDDKVYRRLKRLKDKYYDDYRDFVDHRLNMLITAHTDMIEAGANALLLEPLMRLMVGLLATMSSQAGVSDVVPPSVESDLQGFGDDIKSITRGIRVQISDHIQEMLRHNPATEKGAAENEPANR